MPTAVPSALPSAKPTPTPPPTPWDYTALLMRNESFGGGNYSVQMFEEATARANGELLGCNTGWSRYLDWHLGVYCDAATSLDAIGPKLCEAGVGYHAHISSMAASSKWGSIWTGGVGGWGVEFHMKFDFSFFNQSRLDLLDYCEESSSGICTADECDMSDIA